MSIYAYQLLNGLGISQQRLLRMLPNISVRSFDPGHIICRKGVRFESFSHVLSGLICAGAPEPDGSITPIHILGPGSWYGVDAILNPDAAAFETACLTPVRMLNMPLADAIEAFQCEPQFSQFLAHLASWRSQRHAERLTHMRLDSPQLRVVMGLALFAESLHSSNSHLPTNAFNEVQEIPLKQSLLASMCGVSRGIFSESAQQLAAAGWIRLSYATLSLSNMPVWRKFYNNHRHNRHNNHKPSMQEIMRLMSEATVS